MSVMPACVHSMCGKVAHVMSYAFEGDFGSLLGPSAQLVSMHFQQHANRQYLQAILVLSGGRCKTLHDIQISCP